MKQLLFSALLAWLPCGARAQTVWPPPLPELQKAAPRPEAHAIPADVVDAVASKLSQYDFRGLKAEAARLQAWAKDRGALTWGEAGLADSTGGSLPVSKEMAEVLRHSQEYFSMTDPSHAELEAAALSPVGIARIKELFDSAIARRVKTPSGPAVPEIGGMAVIDHGLDFREVEEPTRLALRELAESAGDPKKLAELYAKYPDAMKSLDENGLLSNALQRLPAWEARGLPKAERERVLRLTVDTVLRNGSDSYVFDPETQFKAVASQDWAGRYVGLWHIHPPQFQASGWGPGDVPSGPDMDIASREGQNAVVAFSPDGFDLYDLSPLSGSKQQDLTKVLKTTYRSAAWRAHFQALFDRAK